MKTNFWVLALLLTFSVTAFAQEKKVKEKLTHEQRVEKRVAKMQKYLLLDDATAEKFAPMYKEYLLERAKCCEDIVRGKELSDEQIKKNIEARMEAKQKALDVDKKYYGKLSKILNAKQLQKVFCEKSFKKNGDKKFLHHKGKSKVKPCSKK